MKRLLFIYISVFALSMMGFVWMINSAPNPEKAILGQWTESAWEYERVNSRADKQHWEMLGKRETGMVIHKAETWSFLPNGKLILSKGNDYQVDTASWSIKGRGNVLEIRYDNGWREHYDLTRLTAEQMTLNFELDTQIKGVAKLTFDKLN